MTGYAIVKIVLIVKKSNGHALPETFNPGRLIFFSVP
jgi:hypothetical protein